MRLAFTVALLALMIGLNGCIPIRDANKPIATLLVPAQPETANTDAMARLSAVSVDLTGVFIFVFLVSRFRSLTGGVAPSV